MLGKDDGLASVVYEYRFVLKHLAIPIVMATEAQEHSSGQDRVDGKKIVLGTFLAAGEVAFAEIFTTPTGQSKGCG